MEKINIAEILKDCPKGMELDCTVYGDVYFDRVEGFFINCYIQEDNYRMAIKFDRYGQLQSLGKAKCVIFPKGKTTWEGFQRPFKDGDVVFYNNTIAIFKEWGDETLFRTYCVFYTTVSNPTYQFEINRPLFGKGIRREARFATEEEKQKLFDAIKANGYKWNPETKTLEKLVITKFKVGDIIQDIDTYKVKITEVNIEDEFYGYESMIAKGIGAISFSEQDDWKLVPNKFDITTLKAFDRVLVRDNDTQKWTADFFSFFDKSNIYPYICVGHYTNQCIPYDDETKHLLGTTNKCDDYFKTWE